MSVSIPIKPELYASLANETHQEHAIRVLKYIVSHSHKFQHLSTKDCVLFVDFDFRRHAAHLLEVRSIALECITQSKTSPTYTHVQPELNLYVELANDKIKTPEKIHLLMTFLHPTKKCYVFKAALQTHCLPGCGALATKTCSKCYQQKYCSTACQAKDWPVHEKTCISIDSRLNVHEGLVYAA